jgi:ribonuclease VapC
LIVVDTSALIAILRAEDDAHAFTRSLAETPLCVIGAPTKFELLLVMGRPYCETGLGVATRLIENYSLEVRDWTSELSDIAGRAFVDYGKGRHPAALNFGDCMAYALAKSLDAPLLYKGDDFAKTDIRSALA